MRNRQNRPPNQNGKQKKGKEQKTGNEAQPPSLPARAGLFADADLVFSYSRAQAIADGVLVDVSEMAREAGFRYPVAATAALWNDIENISEEYQGFEDVKGRLWDVLWMGMNAVRMSKTDGSELLYKLILHTGGNEEYTVKLVVGPGDNREPVITLMLPDED